MDTKVKFTTVLTRELLDKAGAHDILQHRSDSVGCSIVGVAYNVALRALREDIQSMVDKIVEEWGPQFWAEIFADDRSDCKYCVCGLCSMYRGNDGIDFACSYAYEVPGYECVCIRTQAAERAFPKLFDEMKVDGLIKGDFYKE